MVGTSSHARTFRELANAFLLSRRGRNQFPQFLHQGRYDEIRKSWLNHGVPTFVARKLEAITDHVRRFRLSSVPSYEADLFRARRVDGPRWWVFQRLDESPERC